MKKNFNSINGKPQSPLNVKHLFAYSPIHLFTRKCKAFTLAEVLITLAVIGIVAAMTIPTLINKFDKHLFVVRAKQTYAILSQAFELSKIDNGEVATWDIPQNTSSDNTGIFLEKYFLPYIKNPIFCEDGKYVENKDKKCDFAPFTYSKTYILPNGVVIGLLPCGGDIKGKCSINMIFDVNGKKDPNRLGNDRFQFMLYENGKLSHILEPYNVDLKNKNYTRDDILNTKVDYETYGPFGCTEDGNRSGCTTLIMMDGWTVKDDYPW